MGILLFVLTKYFLPDGPPEYSHGHVIGIVDLGIARLYLPLVLWIQGHKMYGEENRYFKPGARQSFLKVCAIPDS
jgi:hypothetical protein